MAYWITAALAVISAGFIVFNPNSSPTNLRSANKLGDGSGYFDTDLDDDIFYNETIPEGEGEEFNIEDADEWGEEESDDNASDQKKEIDCKWTGCEGLLILGQVICNNYKAGWYIGLTNKKDCGFTSTRCLCCKATPGKPKRWSKKCYGTAYSNIYVCGSEFGRGFVPTGNTKTCSGWGMTQYECTN